MPEELGAPMEATGVESALVSVGTDHKFAGQFTDGEYIGEISGPDGSFFGMVTDLGRGRFRIDDYSSAATFEIGEPEAASMGAPEAGPASAEPRADLGFVKVPAEEADTALEAAALAAQVEAPVTAAPATVPKEVSVAPDALGLEPVADAGEPIVGQVSTGETAAALVTPAAETPAAREFDDRLAQANSIEEVVGLLNDRLNQSQETLDARQRRLVDLETERQGLWLELTAVKPYAHRDLPAEDRQDAFSVREREMITEAKSRVAAIKERLDEIDGVDGKSGELQGAKEVLSNDQEEAAMRVAAIEMARREAQLWQHLAEHPNDFQRYLKMRDTVAKYRESLAHPETSPLAPSVVEMQLREAEGDLLKLQTTLPSKLFELEGLIPERKYAPEGSEDPALHVFEENYVYERAAQRMRDLLKATPAAPAVAAPAEPELVEAEAELARVAEPEVEPVGLEMPEVELPTSEEPGQVGVELVDGKVNIRVGRKTVGGSDVESTRGYLAEQASGENTIRDMTPDEAQEALRQLDELMGDAVATEMPPAPGLDTDEAVSASQVVIDVAPAEVAPSGDRRAEPEASPVTPEAPAPDEALGVAIEAFGESVNNPDGSKSSRERKQVVLAAAEGVLAAAARLGQTGPEASQRAQRALAPLVGAAPQWFGLAGRRLLAREVTDGQGHYLSEAELKNHQDTGFLEALLELLLTLGDKTIDAVVAEVKNKTEGK